MNDKTPFQVVRDLQREQPGLGFRMTVKTAHLHLRPLDEETTSALARLEREDPATLAQVEKRRGVVQHYPILQPLDSLLQHLDIAYARRCMFMNAAGGRSPHVRSR